MSITREFTNLQSDTVEKVQSETDSQEKNETTRSTEMNVQLPFVLLERLKLEDIQKKCEEHGCRFMHDCYKMPRCKFIVEHNHFPVHQKQREAAKNVVSCPICSRQLTKGLLKIHLENHSSMRYKCQEPNCGWMFERFGVLRNHYVHHHNKTIKIKPAKLECPFCKRILLPKKYGDHVQNHNGMKYRCKFFGCGWMFEDFIVLQSHHYEIHKVKLNRADHETLYRIVQNVVNTGDEHTEKTGNSNTMVSCEICGRKYSGMNGFYNRQRHIENHSDLKFKCPHDKCGWMFSALSSLRNHHIEKHGEHLNYEFLLKTKSKCSICSRLFQNENYLQKHMENHDNMKYRCTVDGCGYMFMEFNLLQTHLKRVHNIKVQVAKDESKFLISPELYDPSDRTSRFKPRKFPCSKCGRYLFKTHLDEHLENHNDMKFQCREPNCGWMYEKYVTLKRHYESRHNFNLNDLDEYNYKIHGEEDGIEKEEELYSCPICTRPFFNDKICDNHIKAHSKLKEVCAESGCGWAFRNCGDLRKHYTDNHRLFVVKSQKGDLIVFGSSENENVDKRHCSICGRVFRGEFDEQHLMYHDQIKFKCLESGCGWMYETYSAFKHHYKANHVLYLHEDGEKEYLDSGQIKFGQCLDTEESFKGCSPCSVCSRKLSKDTLAQHEENHKHLTHMFKCPEDNCGWMYENYSTLKGHCFSKHELIVSSDKTTNLVATNRVSNEDTECTLCGRHLSEAQYAKHLEQHDDLKYTCKEDNCGWMYEEFDTLCQHYSVKHRLKITHKEKEDYETKKKEMYVYCPICGRRFLKESVLNLHIQCHDKLKYKCEEDGCGWLFQVPSFLKEHQRRAHNMSRPIECPICTRLLAMHMYDYHVNCHDKMKFRCPIKDCGWKFETLIAVRGHCLKKHDKKIVNNRDFMVPSRQECPICSRVLSDNAFDNHMKDHNKMKFKCLKKDCGWMYETFEGLQHHYANKHEIQITKGEKQKYIHRQRTMMEYATYMKSREIVKTQHKTNVSETVVNNSSQSNSLKRKRNDSADVAESKDDIQIVKDVCESENDIQLIDDISNSEDDVQLIEDTEESEDDVLLLSEACNSDDDVQLVNDTSENEDDIQIVQQAKRRRTDSNRKDPIHSAASNVPDISQQHSCAKDALKLKAITCTKNNEPNISEYFANTVRGNDATGRVVQIVIKPQNDPGSGEPWAVSLDNKENLTTQLVKVPLQQTSPQTH